jgi:hypothetical protein
MEQAPRARHGLGTGCGHALPLQIHTTKILQDNIRQEKARYRAK